MDIKEWSKEIQEFVISKDVKIDGINYPLQTVTELTGHNINQWNIHGGIYLPSFPLNYPQRIKEDNYAVEIFVTTGKNKIRYDNDDNSHYKLTKYINTKFNRLNVFQKEIQKRFKTLPFCDRWLSDLPSYKTNLNILKKKVF